MACGSRRTVGATAATWSPPKPSWPSRSARAPGCWTAWPSKPGPMRRPISPCSARLRSRRWRTGRPAGAISPCGCGRTRICAARWSSLPQPGHRGGGGARRRRQHHRRGVRGRAEQRAVRHRNLPAAGRIRPDAQGAPVADLDIGLVDYTGGLAEGRLRRGENPVLMTVELAIKATG